MSATGATDAQIEAAIRRYMERSELPEWYIESALQERPSGTVMTVDAWAKYLVPPGYQIVPAGAVVLTAEEAALCQEACELAASEADGESTGFASIAFIDAANEQTQRAVAFRALAAKLGGAS